MSPVRNWRIGFVSHICPSPRLAPPGVGFVLHNRPPPPELALFCRGLLHVRFTITPFPPSTCPAFWSGENWLCLYRQASDWGGRMIGQCNGGVSRPPGIGFVSHNRPRVPAGLGRIGFVAGTTPGNEALSHDWLRPIGFVCATAPHRPGVVGAGASRRNWLCFAEAYCMYDSP